MVSWVHHLCTTYTDRQHMEQQIHETHTQMKLTNKAPGSSVLLSESHTHAHHLPPSSTHRSPRVPAHVWDHVGSLL